MHAICVCDRVFLSRKRSARGGNIKDSNGVIMGLAHFLPANAKCGKTKHYKKIHIDTNIHRDVCLYYLLYRTGSGSGVCLKKQQ